MWQTCAKIVFVWESMIGVWQSGKAQRFIDTANNLRIVVSFGAGEIAMLL